MREANCRAQVAVDAILEAEDVIKLNVEPVLLEPTTSDVTPGVPGGGNSVTSTSAGLPNEPSDPKSPLIEVVERKALVDTLSLFATIGTGVREKSNVFDSKSQSDG
eukprot:CAMPEP_0119413500 /NCGR_PEP_ID=MMETSP1335-20130426/5567_1 /TAXON_ID=259385 /ORGANISM="Chrysoculter rhomboideus, Strain RCC1486" /LENGTH=105 /DNA_ID=CAMNT_0007438297 /DNA_START=333 /DNA_END=651 /DNA_ORIENTATION=+